MKDIHQSIKQVIENFSINYKYWLVMCMLSIGKFLAASLNNVNITLKVIKIWIMYRKLPVRTLPAHSAGHYGLTEIWQLF